MSNSEYFCIKEKWKTFQKVMSSYHESLAFTIHNKDKCDMQTNCTMLSEKAWRQIQILDLEGLSHW